MTTQIKAGVIAANAVNSSELASGALSGQNFTGNVAFDTTTLKIDSSNNRVGIGTDSPSGTLDVQAANAGQGIRLTATTGTNGAQYKATTGAGNLYMGIDTSVGGSFGKANSAVFWYDAAQSMVFATNNAEKMRIDSLGNLLVGTTSLAVSSSTGSVTGSVINTTGLFEAAKTGTVMELNRLTADGTILNFRKDGSTVGSIGTKSGGLFIGSDDAGIFFNHHGSGDLDAVIPYDIGQSSFYDGHVNLGASGGQFKDLYLSGTANAAKLKLDNPSSFTNMIEYGNVTWNQNTGHGLVAVNRGSDGYVQLQITSGVDNADVFTIRNSGTGANVQHNLLSNGNVYHAGNVGIGTTSPSYKLVLRDDSTSAYLLSLENNNIGTAGVHTGIRFGYTGNTYQKGAIIFEGQDGNGRGKMYFAMEGTANSSNADETDAKMTIDYSGNVGIGTTSPVGKLSISDSGATGVEFSPDDSNARVQQLYYDRVDNAYRTSLFDAGDYQFRISGAEKMRINSSGQVIISTDYNSPQLSAMGYGDWEDLPLQLRDTSLTNTAGYAVTGIGFGYSTETTAAIVVSDAGGGAAQSMSFITGTNASAVPRMTIDSLGNLLVGKTDTAVGSNGQIMKPNGETFHTIASANNTLHVYSSTASAYRFYVSHAGQIHATSTSITAISDERLKENIKDLETGLSEVMSLQPRRFDWKNGDGENVAGFIAQEVETVLPDLISDYKHEDLDDAKSVKMGDMLPTLVKAIQEQQTIIDDLKSRITKLEG